MERIRVEMDTVLVAFQYPPVAFAVVARRVPNYDVLVLGIAILINLVEVDRPLNSGRLLRGPRGGRLDFFGANALWPLILVLSLLTGGVVIVLTEAMGSEGPRPLWKCLFGLAINLGVGFSLRLQRVSEGITHDNELYLHLHCQSRLEVR
jgi:hypothetical protein